MSDTAADPATVIDPSAVHRLARSVSRGANELRAEESALRAMPALSDSSAAGPALREFAGLCVRAAEILAGSAAQLATTTHDSASLWCTIDRAAGGR
ncbi:MAG TPA: hypothetical protein VHC49_01775 [Mycobacteriales bacterium]|nr:hypothetical protein [Mycobacteriales bacterium]